MRDGLRENAERVRAAVKRNRLHGRCVRRFDSPVLPGNQRSDQMSLLFLTFSLPSGMPFQRSSAVRSPAGTDEGADRLCPCRSPDMMRSPSSPSRSTWAPGPYAHARREAHVAVFSGLAHVEALPVQRFGKCGQRGHGKRVQASAEHAYFGMDETRIDTQIAELCLAQHFGLHGIVGIGQGTFGAARLAESCHEESLRVAHLG